MSDNDPQSEPLDVLSRLEALLFVASTPIRAWHFADVLELSTKEVEDLLNELIVRYKGRGITIQVYGGKYQFTTAAEYAADVEKFLGLEITSRLSKAAVETMAIVAYRQPITRPAIEAIRGVSSDGVMRSLLSRGLIQEVGRADGPGRPILFSTTADFLQHFGLDSLDQLPPYETPEEEAKPTNGLLKD
jgi:segregation and condensation protein B